MKLRLANALWALKGQGFSRAATARQSRRALASGVGRFCKRFALALLLTFLAAPAFAQGCAMCYSNARGASYDGQRAISRAVLVLLAPPVGFMTIGVGLALQYGKKRDRDADEDQPPSETHPI